MVQWYFTNSSANGIYHFNLFQENAYLLFYGKMKESSVNGMVRTLASHIPVEQYGKFDLCPGDLNCLRPDEWINDQVNYISFQLKQSCNNFINL